MRILVFSDSHGYTEGCAQTIRRIVGADMVLHAGDHIRDAREIEKMFPEIEFKYVPGNCDFSSEPSDIIFETCGYKILLTHGHGYNVKYESDYDSLRKKGEETGCDCIVFGHTHESINDITKKPILLNPGSIKHGGTFGVIEIEDGVLKTAVCNA